MNHSIQKGISNCAVIMILPIQESLQTHNENTMNGKDKEDRTILGHTYLAGIWLRSTRRLVWD